MKSTAIVFLVAVLIGTPALADKILFEVTAAKNKVKTPGVFSLDSCTLSASVQNARDEDIELELFLKPALNEDSFSAATASASGAFGRTDSFYFGKIERGQTDTDDESLLSVDCDHIVGLAVDPVCTMIPSRDDCSDAVFASDESVLAVALTTAEPGAVVGGTPAETGPLQGDWGIYSRAGALWLTLFIEDDDSDDLGGFFETTSDVCTFLKQTDDCAAGALSKDIRLIYKDGEDLKIRLQFSDVPNKGGIIINVNPTTGRGKIIDDETYKRSTVTLQKIE